MGPDQIALLIVSGLALIESAWALMAPGALRKALDGLAGADRQTFAWMGGFFLALGMLLGVLTVTGEPPVRQALAAVSLLFISEGLLCFHPSYAVSLLNVWILQRSNAGIRRNYLFVMLIALILMRLSLV